MCSSDLQGPAGPHEHGQQALHGGVSYFGKWIKAIGGYFIQRKNPKDALRSLSKGAEHLKSGYNLAIFPEGTRSKGPEMSPFKAGSFKLATMAKATRLLQEEFSQLKKRYWGQHLWGRGYFCATVGSVTEEMIKEYIEKHAESSSQITVQGEF